MVAVPLIAPLGLAVTDGTALRMPWHLFLTLTTAIPLSLALMLCLAYAMEFGAPSVESLGALKTKVRAFQSTNGPKIGR